MKYKMTNENNSIFDNIFDFPFFKFNRFSQVMKSDIIEYADYYKILIDVPGCQKEDIRLVSSNGYIEVYISKLSEENNEDNPDEVTNYLLKERYFGEFNRKFYVGNIEKNKVKASLKNGVLELLIKKTKEVEEDNFIEIK